MPVYLDTRSNSVLSVGICDRCNRKFPYVDLMPDPNFPGMRVCKVDLDEYDPWRLPARQTENIALRWPRPDVSIALQANQILTTGGPGQNSLFIEGVPPAGGSQGDLNSASTPTNAPTSLYPIIYSVAPNTGSHLGGTSVTILGNNFTSATAVKFGGVNAASYNVITSTEIIAVTPAYAITGIVDVNVISAFGTAVAHGIFTYT